MLDMILKKLLCLRCLFSAFEIWFKQTLEDLGDVITTFQIPVGIPQFKRELNLFIDTNFINCTPCTRKPCSRQYFRHKIRTEYQTFKPCQKLYYIPCTILRIKMRWNRNKTIVIILYFLYKWNSKSLFAFNWVSCIICETTNGF